MGRLDSTFVEPYNSWANITRMQVGQKLKDLGFLTYILNTPELTLKDSSATSLQGPTLQAQ